MKYTEVFYDSVVTAIPFSAFMLYFANVDGALAILVDHKKCDIMENNCKSRKIKLECSQGEIVVSLSLQTTHKF